MFWDGQPGVVGAGADSGGRDAASSSDVVVVVALDAVALCPSMAFQFLGYVFGVQTLSVPFENECYFANEVVNA